MKRLLLGTATLSVALWTGAAWADNSNVPSWSPYAVMQPAPPYLERGPAPSGVYRRHRELREGRAVFREPNYAHETAPPPGMMFDQPSTIGGYPIGY